jgi:hypothetical protein
LPEENGERRNGRQEAEGASFVEAFKQGMRDNGMVEGRDYVLDLRYADGDIAAFRHLPPKWCSVRPPRLS